MYEARLRHDVYDAVMRTGRVPSVDTLVESSGLPERQVRHTLVTLATSRVLVLQRESGEILMAPPFSAVPTPFLVETAQYSTYGNCIWDAIGIAAMLNQPITIRTSCGCCGEAMQLEVTHDGVGIADDVSLARPHPLVHFAIPARRWWVDVVFT